MTFDCTKITPVGKQCQCNIPDGGWCEPHQVNKTAHYVELCRTKPRYRKAWDECRGPRQDFINYKVGGPGSELTQLFSKFNIAPGGCHCKSHSLQMDRWGPDKCLEKMDTILGWLEQEAKKRNLPFVRVAAKVMVKLACWRARRAINKVTQDGN